jgi:hypothetical protein
MRINRINRLASIILNDFLPYFRYFATPTWPEPRQMLETSLDAHSLWESDLVQAVTTAEAAQAYTVSRVKYAIPSLIVSTVLNFLSQ